MHTLCYVSYMLVSFPKETLLVRLGGESSPLPGAGGTPPDTADPDDLATALLLPPPAALAPPPLSSPSTPSASPSGNNSLGSYGLGPVRVKKLTLSTCSEVTMFRWMDTTRMTCPSSSRYRLMISAKSFSSCTRRRMSASPTQTHTQL